MSDIPNRTEDIIREQLITQRNNIFSLLINTINSSSSDINNNEEGVETIPCEFCNQQIAINNYSVHSQRCLERAEIESRIRMNSINRRRELEITQPSNNVFTPISFNFDTYNNNYSAFNSEVNDEEVNDEEVNDEEVNDEEVNDDIVINENNGLPEVSEVVDNNANIIDGYDSDDSIPPLVDDNEYVNEDLLTHIDDNELYTNIVNMVRENIYSNNSAPVYINYPLIFNELTQNINSESNINLSDIITQFIGITRPEPLNLDKVISSLDDDINDDDGNPLECPICYDNFNELKNTENTNNTTEREPVKILCGHKYCDRCIVKWFNKNSHCPVCKCDMKELLKKEEDAKKQTEKNNSEEQYTEYHEPHEDNEIMDIN